MISPITGDYTVGKGLIFFRPAGQDHFEELGDCDGFDLDMNFDEVERKSNQYGVAKLAHSAVISTDVSISLTLMQMINRNMALGVASDLTELTQAQAAGQTHAVTAVKVGGIYELPHIGVSGVSVTDGAAEPVSYVLGTHYELDAEAGLIKVLAIPATAAADIEIAYTADAIASAAGRVKLGIASNPNIRGHLRFRGVNDIGRKVLVDIWDVQMRPSGKRSYIGNEYMQVELSGKLFAAGGKGQGYEFGMERTL